MEFTFEKATIWPLLWSLKIQMWTAYKKHLQLKFTFEKAIFICMTKTAPFMDRWKNFKSRMTQRNSQPTQNSFLGNNISKTKRSFKSSLHACTWRDMRCIHLKSYTTLTILHQINVRQPPITPSFPSNQSNSIEVARESSSLAQPKWLQTKPLAQRAT